MALAAELGTVIERKALVALRWMDRAYLTGDQLVTLLYRFFALDALPETLTAANEIPSIHAGTGRAPDGRLSRTGSGSS